MKVDFRVPTEKDLAELEANISFDDARELSANGVSLDWAIRMSVENSVEAVSFLVDGELACIVGVTDGEGLVGPVFPWVLGTPLMQKYPRKVLYYSHKILNRWKAEYPYMTNYVDVRHHRAITWLTHLGASFEYIPMHGPYRRPFYKFSFGSES
jgi:hypothetical protein